MDPLLTALAGGAIGTILLGLAWTGVRVAAIPGDLSRHDYEARVLNEDLELWVADRYRELKRELNGITNRMAGDGQLYSGAHGVARADAKTRALHQWRDRKHQAERDFAALQAKETWAHGLWRKLSRTREELELTAPVRAEPVIEEMRKRVTRHGEPTVRVHDPTRFRLEELLGRITTSPLEPGVPPKPVQSEDYDRPAVVENEPPPEYE